MKIKILSQAASENLVHALIMPRIDFCNSLLYNLSDMQISKLQRIQNSAARFNSQTHFSSPTHFPYSSGITLATGKTKDQIQNSSLNFSMFVWHRSSYIQELIRLYTPARNLRSSSKSLLISPSVKTYFYGGRSFQSAAADLWNNLPESVESVNTTERFKRVLKTHLFTP